MSVSLKLIERVSQIQAILANSECEGFLLYIIKEQNPFAKDLLEIKPTVNLSRRFFYLIPREGEPKKIVNQVDCHPLRHIYGNDCPYLGHVELAKVLKKHLPKRVCMQYSPMAELATHSIVDAGTLEFIRSLGVEVSSSEGLIQELESRLTPNQIKEHFISEKMVDRVANDAFNFCRQAFSDRGFLYEKELQSFIMDALHGSGFVFEGEPICAVNENSANPHYEIEGNGSKITPDDYLLIDLWAKRDVADGVYADITRVISFSKPSCRQLEVFEWVRQAQREAVELIESRLASDKPVFGFEADRACFEYLAAKGVQGAIKHRTGHNITGELHGPGANLDNLEAIDKRALIKSSCYSVEPALYFEGEFGLRLEHDILIDEKGVVHVTGGVQNKLV
jgi:Xaa-Pro dipeptidase